MFDISPELLEKMRLLSKPLDVEKYISDGVISRLTKRSKTRFVVHVNLNDLPIDITERIRAIENKNLRNGTSKTIITINLKVLKIKI